MTRSILKLKFELKKDYQGRVERYLGTYRPFWLREPNNIYRERMGSCNSVLTKKAKMPIKSNLASLSGKVWIAVSY